jgi:toxin YoeB
MPARRIEFDEQGWSDLRYWYDTNRKVAQRLAGLVDAARRDPFDELGKPEPLKRAGPNTWSRRITDEHRLVYRVESERIVVLRARGHYDD